MAPQCRAFNRALEIEKLKAPLFRGPEGAGDTNDWCIRPGHYTNDSHIILGFYAVDRITVFDSVLGRAVINVDRPCGPTHLSCMFQC